MKSRQGDVGYRISEGVIGLSGRDDLAQCVVPLGNDPITRSAINLQFR